MTEFEIKLKPVAPMQVAALRDVIENYGAVGRLFDELMGEVGKAELTPAGPTFAMYHDPGPKDKDVDVEVAIPVTDGMDQLAGRVKLRELQGHPEMASLIRVGAYDDFSPAYQALMDWINSHGYQIVGPNREIYLRGPEADIPAEQYVTEIQFPVAKA